jgi:hypothetical protein
MFILPDFPENSSNWLSLELQALAQRRMVEDAGMDEDIHLKRRSTAGLFMALSDWKVWCKQLPAIRCARYIGSI